MKIVQGQRRTNSTIVNRTAPTRTDEVPDKEMPPNLSKPTISPNIPLSERIAIKQLKIDIKKMQFDLDYGDGEGDGDQIKRRRRLDIAVSELEVLLMRYEMVYGVEYVG